jgi:ribonucleoside-diphosphate reductase beta chain
LKSAASCRASPRASAAWRPTSTADVAYGTWHLREQAADPGLRRRIGDRLLELLPVTAAVLVPPGVDPERWSLLGYGADEINGFAFTALTRRLKIIGVDLAAAPA